MSAFIEYAARAGSLAITAWLVMIALGAAHSHDGRIPAPGYLTVGWVLVAATAGVTYLRHLED